MHFENVSTFSPPSSSAASNISITDSKINGNITLLQFFGDSERGRVLISNVTQTDGKINLSNVGASLISISDSAFSNSEPESDSLYFENVNIRDIQIINNTVTNGSVHFNRASGSGGFYMYENQISNTKDLLKFDVSFGFEDKYIYNNKFSADTENYIRAAEMISGFFLNVTPREGYGLTGGPRVAGNYWTTPAGNGYSDSLPSNDNGYSDTPYILLETETEDFIDSHPLTKYAASPENTSRPQSHSKNNWIPNQTADPALDPTSDQTNDPLSDQTTDPSSNQTSDQSSNQTSDQSSDRTTDFEKDTASEKDSRKGWSLSKKNFSQTNPHNKLNQLKEENLSTEEVVLEYIVPAAAVAGATVSAFVLFLTSVIDLFFDVTSTQVRDMAHERKLKITFAPPTLNNIFTARTAFMALMFFIGVCLVDMILGDLVDAALDKGLLEFITVIIPPLVVSTVINVGGGLFIDEVIDAVLIKTGKHIRTKTGILDWIEKNRNVNIAVFFVIVGVSAAFVTFFILFLDWTLV